MAEWRQPQIINVVSRIAESKLIAKAASSTTTTFHAMRSSLFCIQEIKTSLSNFKVYFSITHAHIAWNIEYLIEICLIPRKKCLFIVINKTSTNKRFARRKNNIRALRLESELTVIKNNDIFMGTFELSSNSKWETIYICAGKKLLFSLSSAVSSSCCLSPSIEKYFENTFHHIYGKKSKQNVYVIHSRLWPTIIMRFDIDLCVDRSENGENIVGCARCTIGTHATVYSRHTLHNTQYILYRHRHIENRSWTYRSVHCRARCATTLRMAIIAACYVEKMSAVIVHNIPILSRYMGMITLPPLE